MNYVLCLCPSERSQIQKHLIVFISVLGTHFREAHVSRHSIRSINTRIHAAVDDDVTDAFHDYIVTPTSIVALTDPTNKKDITELSAQLDD